MLAGELARGAFLLAAGGGVGLTGTGGGSRPYALATISFGLDPREGDRITAVGGTLGYETASLPGVFAEVRYERWIQRGLRYFDIPENVVSAGVGIVVHNRRRAGG